ncbi:MAG: hypothetical protein V2J12_08325 [Gammaproteobacteria bacterium]|nr:hypothetical protein [Gammaproteobacteria bacterium]
MRVNQPIARRVSMLAGIACATLIAGCSSGPRISRTQPLAADAAVPFEHVLVIAVFESFDSRMNLEKELVKNLAASGTRATAATASLKTTTVVNRDLILKMLESIPADAVLVTQIASQASTMGVRTANPEVTRNITPTYYFNVWEVEVTEYIEPPSMEVTSDLVLATQLYQVSDQQPVWAIESKGTIVKDVRRPGYFEFIVKEAAAIARAMQRDGVVR